MSWSRWKPFELLLRRFAIRPILAIVPDNRDPELIIDQPLEDFWLRVRNLECEGATIALHGYRHLCNARGRSLVPLHAASEFAGVDESQQIDWLRAGLHILRHHQLTPRLFIAPRHGFDRATLCALQTVDLPVLSDGLTRKPSLIGGVTWIPQQMWEPVPRASGLWTICIHPNTATSALVTRLERFLELYAEQFTSFDDVMALEQPARITIPENLYAAAFLTRFRSRQILKQIHRSPRQAISSRAQTRG